MNRIFLSFIFTIIFINSSCAHNKTNEYNTPIEESLNEYAHVDTFAMKLAEAATLIIDRSIRYVPNYTQIAYPNGDVDPRTGVCTDVVIRAYRRLGIDLQKEVHEDMKANFSLYPSKRKWGLNATDTNIDHRRVPNLQVFFKRKGTEKPISADPKDYLPGDIVTWDLCKGMTHIGIVIDQKSKEDGITPLIVHNIGGGQVKQNCLFAWKITGHYTYKKQRIK